MGLRNLFSRRRRAAEPAAPEVEPAMQPADKATPTDALSSLSQASADSVVHVYVVNRNNEKSWFRLTQKGVLKACTTPPTDMRTVLIHDEKVMRLEMPKRYADHAAEKALRKKFKRKASIINRTNKTRVVYGIEERTAYASAYKQQPMVLLFDDAVAAQKPDLVEDGGAYAVAAVFEATNGHYVTVAAYESKRKLGGLGSFVETTDTDSTIVSLLRRLAQATNLPGLTSLLGKSGGSEEKRKSEEQRFLATRVVRITGADLWTAAKLAPGFPREPMAYGRPVREWFILSAVVTGVLATASGAAWVGLHYFTKETDRTTAEVQRHQADKQAAVRAELLSVLDNLPLHVTLHPTQLFAFAEAVYVPTGRVSLEASQDRAIVALTLSTQRATSLLGTNRRQTNLGVDRERLLAALSLTPPADFQLESIQTSGDLNAITVSFAGRTIDRRLLDLVGDTGNAATPQVPGVPGGPPPSLISPAK